MKQLQRFFDIGSDTATTKTTIIYILIAYLFSVAVRLTLYYHISDDSSYFYNGSVIPLWSADSGLYGFYANQLLAGVSYPINAEYMPGYLLYWVVMLTGFKVGNVLYFAPAVLASLIVIPIILLARHYGITKLGFYAALLGTISTAFYYRTYLGFYDTDILNVFFPLLSIYFLIKLVDTQKLFYALFAALSLIGFVLWYHSAIAIVASIILMYTFYILLFQRTETYAYQALLILAVAVLPLPLPYNVLILLLLYTLLHILSRYQTINYKYYFIPIVVGLLIFPFVVNTQKYYDRADDYIDKSSFIQVHSAKGDLKLKADLDTVAEAQSFDIAEFSRLLAGSTPFFIFAIFGYLLLLIRYPSMLLTLPLAFLTFVAMIAGMRFVMYGSMLFSFGLVFGTYIVFYNILTQWGEFSSKISTISSNVFIVLVMLFSLNIVLDKDATSPIFFSSTEDMKALDELKNNHTRNDFILTWWDYGWPLWYYTNLSTLIDNGKHQQDNYVVSKILLDDNETFVRNASVFFVEKYFEGRKKGFPKVMNYFLTNYSFDYLETLKQTNIDLPTPKRDIYILLHKHMLTTLSNIEAFSNLDIKTGQPLRPNFMGSSPLLKTDKIETDTFVISLDNGTLLPKQLGRTPLKATKITVIKENKILFQKDYVESDGLYIIIYDGLVLVMKEKMYNSFLVQTLIFDQYNHNYFEKTAETDNFMIFKVKNGQ